MLLGGLPPPPPVGTAEGNGEFGGGEPRPEEGQRRVRGHLTAQPEGDELPHPEGASDPHGGEEEHQLLVTELADVHPQGLDQPLGAGGEGEAALSGKEAEAHGHLQLPPLGEPPRAGQAGGGAHHVTVHFRTVPGEFGGLELAKGDGLEADLLAGAEQLRLDREVEAEVLPPPPSAHTAHGGVVIEKQAQVHRLLGGLARLGEMDLEIRLLCADPDAQREAAEPLLHAEGGTSGEEADLFGEISGTFAPLLSLQGEGEVVHEQTRPGVGHGRAEKAEEEDGEFLFHLVSPLCRSRYFR